MKNILIKPISGHKNWRIYAIITSIKAGILILVLALYTMRTHAQIYAVGNDDGFSFSCAGSAGGELFLPVVWGSFSATCKPGKIVLHWSASTNSQHHFFAIERSRDGKTFFELQRIDANTFDEAPSEYLFIDSFPLRSSAYYRISQADVGGEKHHSNTVVSACKSNYRCQMHPNPGFGKFTLFMPEETGSAQITDIAGRVVHTTHLLQGQNNILLEDQPPGVYLAHITHGETTTTQRLLLER